MDRFRFDIIASTNPSRRYQKHSGAILALNQKSMFKNTIVGVIGISSLLLAVD